LGLALALFVLDDRTGAIFTVFGTIGLLVNADFAGSAAQRLGSYLLTGLAGSMVLVLGWATSPTTLMAVVLTVAVAFCLSFVNLLRGPIAVGTPAVLLIYVVAVSVDGTPTNLRSYLVGWWLAVALCTVTALVLLPRNERLDFRTALAATFTAAADGVASTWQAGPGVAPSTGLAAFSDAVRDLDARFGGQPFRTMGFTQRDQATYLLVALANSARLLLIDDSTGSAERVPSPARDELVEALIATLRDVATAMTDPTHVPSAARLDRARQALASEVEQQVLADSAAGTAAQRITEQITADHTLRMAALIVEQVVEVARVANAADIESLERRPPVPVRSSSLAVLSHLTLQSPWMRNAMRSALGLGLAVWVVQVTDAQKGFWVLLGVISILRFDAVGTRRFAIQAVVGTVAGVLAATALLAVAGQQEWVLWVALPMLVFLAAWSAVAISYPVGQAAFSALVLVVMSIVSWPAQLLLGLVRIEDVALGAAVAVVVGFLMWPRGAIGYLRRQLATALLDGSAYLAAAIGSLVTAPSPGSLEACRRRAIASAELAGETYDLSLMQRGPAEDMRPWTRATVTCFVLISAARVIAELRETAGAVGSHPELVVALDASRAASTAVWADAAATIDPAVGPPERGRAVEPDLPGAVPITSAEDARALMVTVWVVDWVRHLGPLAERDPLSAR
jgi:uncharacterized membrane protein YccC